MTMSEENLNLTLAKTTNYYEDFVDLMPKWGYAASAFALFLIGFFGFFLNLLVIILMYKDKQLWTPLNLILFNLVCSDFSVSILGNPFTLISALYHRWIFGKTMCVIYGFFMTLLGITSITTHTVLSFERYVMVSRPLTSHRLSMKGASFSVFLIWCYSFAVTTPPLMGWGSYVNEAANISCSINWEEQTLNAMTYIMFLFAMGLIIPVTVITFSYMNILKTMKSNACRMGRVAKAESRVTIMVFLMIVAFMIAWTPYSIFALIEQFAPRDLVSPGLAVVPALVAKSSICYDPIIYVGMNTQFRASVKRLLGFGNKDDSLEERAVENTIMSPTRAISHTNANNITLQYLNPNEKSAAAITIYKEEDAKCEEECENKTKNRAETKTGNKKKITIAITSFEDESSECLSVEKGVHAIKNEIERPKDRLCKLLDSTAFSNDSVKAVKLLPNSNERSNNYQDECVKKEDQDGVKEFLLEDQINQYEAFDNVALNCWEENESQIMLSTSPSIKFDIKESIAKMTLPMKRRSFAFTNSKFNEDFSDVQNVKDFYKRRQSTANSYSFNLGHAKKMSTVTHDKGTSITRLMVDERDKSKFGELSMKMDDKKSPKGEQLL